jgi:hypothetical protein
MKVKGQIDKASHDGYAKVQTTLYDLIEATQDTVGVDEEHLVVPAVVQ